MPSTAIKRFRYEPQTRTLLVTFVSGQAYAYEDVPEDVARDFRAAASKGRFFQIRVRDRFAYRRLGDEGADEPQPRRPSLGP